MSVFRSGQTMRIITTDPSQALPAREGGAEVPNSSLAQLREWSLCVRFLTFTFNTYPERVGQVSQIELSRSWPKRAGVAACCDLSTSELSLGVAGVHRLQDPAGQLDSSALRDRVPGLHSVHEGQSRNRPALSIRPVYNFQSQWGHQNEKKFFAFLD